ncbi:MAG: rRNA maturation RNase YbeY [Clostridiales bacterium]|nr:rRNA maturation RNase YbeY [Clostridiales bacterium]
MVEEYLVGEGTPPPSLRELVKAVVDDLLREELGSREAVVELTWADDEHLRSLNRQFRGKDEPTDVLSFPLHQPEELSFWKGPGPLPLGDVVISWPRVLEQAQAYGHSPEREAAFLALHGTLHLLGYDHATPQEEALMEEKAEAILKARGLTRP